MSADLCLSCSRRGLYDTLKKEEIRILRIGYAPATDQDIREAAVQLDNLSSPPNIESLPLQYILETVPLSEEPKYKALSYTWGDPTSTKEIMINGEIISITKNLFVALQHLQFEDTLWIEVICINQSDNLKKNEHVQQMRRIYEEAECVIIFLGPEEDGSNEVLKYFERIEGIAQILGIADLTRDQAMHINKNAEDQPTRDLALKLEQC